MESNDIREKELILGLVGEISPLAREYVEGVYGDAIVLHLQDGAGDKGIFLKVPSEGLCVYYAHYSDDSSPELLGIISHELERSVSWQGELCFNVQGKNRRIIDLIQNKGFSPDMEGYVLSYTRETPAAVAMGRLTTSQEYNPATGAAFVDLFDKAYEQLNLENGWDTKSYSKAAESFCRQVKELHKNRSMQSFWRRDSLVGAYIVNGNYIADIVVHPRWQNKGYGSLLLKHCIRFLREEKKVSEIYLRVTKSNIGAKRLYERNGFTTISHFAEHTYKGKDD